MIWCAFDVIEQLAGNQFEVYYLTNKEIKNKELVWGILNGFERSDIYHRNWNSPYWHRCQRLPSMAMCFAYQRVFFFPHVYLNNSIQPSEGNFWFFFLEKKLCETIKIINNGKKSQMSFGKIGVFMYFISFAIHNVCIKRIHYIITKHFTYFFVVEYILAKKQTSFHW